MTRLSRRSLAKRLTLTSAAAFMSLHGEAQTWRLARHSEESGWTEILPGIWRARIGTPESFTPVSSRLVDINRDGLALLPRVKAAPLALLQGAVSTRGTRVEVPLRANEQVYGFGLQMMSFQQRGKKKTIRVNADPKFDTGDSHAPVPFYVTSEGIGIFVDTARYATFYVGNARPKPTKTLTDINNANPEPNYSHNLQDGDQGLVNIEVPTAQGVDVYLFAGPSMLDVVKRYNLFSGGGVVPPEWGLGFWYRSEARANKEAAVALAKEFRQRRIPCDVWGLEPGWQAHAYSCTFTWNPQRFPEPAAFLRDMKELNLHVNLWEHAFTNPASPIFKELAPKAGDYGVWGGLVPDFSDPAARRIFGGHHAKAFVEAGISGFKLDECDNSDYTGGWSFPEISAFPSGLDGEQMHNIFGLRYQHTIWSEYQKRQMQTYGMVRSSGALAAPYPFVLYSDLYNHRDFIRALVNSGFSGLLWTPEVRDAISEEDLFRRLESVVFSPLAIVNSWYIRSPPWRQLNRTLNNAGEDMPHWEAVEARCREIIGWRMSLVPYLMSAFQQYATDGTPPFRALVLDSPKDSSVAKVDDQYLIGDRVMVAPLFAGESQRKVVFPVGEDWHDFWTGKEISGGSTLSIDQSFDRIPVFVRSGSIMPWAEVGMHAGAPESNRITARIYGDGRRDFRFAGKDGAALFWDGKRGSLIGATRYVITKWDALK